MKNILSISLAFILLLSNVGFTMATHFCSGLAVKSALMIGHHHLHCGMPDMDIETKCGSEEGIRIQPKPCCKNQYQTFEVEDDYRVRTEPPRFHPEFVVAYAQAVFSFAYFKDFSKPPFTAYSPPLLLRDLPVLNQVFLI